MKDDGVIKRETAWNSYMNSTYMYENPQEKQSLDQISYQEQVVWW